MTMLHAVFGSELFVPTMLVALCLLILRAVWLWGMIGVTRARDTKARWYLLSPDADRSIVIVLVPNHRKGEPPVFFYRNWGPARAWAITHPRPHPIRVIPVTNTFRVRRAWKRALAAQIQSDGEYFPPLSSTARNTLRRLLN